jgi:hypothetical protein
MRYGVLLLLVCLAGQAGAERFVTWVDEDGKVRHTRLPIQSLLTVNRKLSGGQGGRAAAFA